MKPRITIITIGIDDLDRSLRFYRDGLGFPTRGIVGTEYEHGAVAFFDLTNGQKLAIWPRSDLAHRAGATITDPPHEAFWGGYTGSFQDPDGHLWEVAWNPEMYPAE
jgi:uncharacterized protein